MKNLIIGINGSKFNSRKAAFSDSWTALGKVCPLYFTGRSHILQDSGKLFSYFEMIDDGGGFRFISECELYQKTHA